MVKFFEIRVYQRQKGSQHQSLATDSFIAQQKESQRRELNSLALDSQLEAAQDASLLPPRSLLAFSMIFHEYSLSFAYLPTSKPSKQKTKNKTKENKNQTQLFKRGLHLQRPMLPKLQSDSLISKGPLNSLLKEIPILSFIFYEKISGLSLPSPQHCLLSHLLFLFVICQKFCML